jgi:phospholipid N-methyltransferase
MIDPISAFGIAANIVQFIEVGYNVTLLFHQILEASATDENLEIATIAEDMSDMCAKFASSSSSRAAAAPLSENEKMLRALSLKGEKLAQELDAVLKGLIVTSQGSRRRVEVMQKALKALAKKKKVSAMQTRLAQLRDEMVIRMISVLEYGFQNTEARCRLTRSQRWPVRRSLETTALIRDWAEDWYRDGERVTPCAR